MSKNNSDRKISLIAFDLDGTLLKNNSDVSDLTAQAIQEAKQKGIYITICTGRVPTLSKVYRQIVQPNAPYICANGALILGVDGKVVYGSPLPRSAFDELGAFCDTHNIPYIAQTAVNMQATKDNPRLIKYEQYRSICRKHNCELPTIAEVCSHTEVDENEIYKVIISAQSDEVRALVQEFLQPKQDVYTYTFSDIDLFDVTAPGADKGAGLKRVADLVGVPMEEVCVFGDFDNDLSSFAIAGTGVAMGNAMPILKEKADFITLSNEEDGIVYALKELEPFFKAVDISYQE